MVEMLRNGPIEYYIAGNAMGFTENIEIMTKAADTLEAKDKLIAELVAVIEEYAGYTDHEGGDSSALRALLSKAKEQE